MTEMVLKNTCEIIVICTNFLMGYLVWYMQKRFGIKSAHNKAIQLLLRRELKEIWNKCMHKKNVTIDELNEFEEIYVAYHELGGNGIATKWHKEMLELEVK